MRQEKGRRGEREGEGDWGGGRKGRWRGTEKKSEERRRRRQLILSLFLLLGTQRVISFIVYIIYCVRLLSMEGSTEHQITCG